MLQILLEICSYLPDHDSAPLLALLIVKQLIALMTFCHRSLPDLELVMESSLMSILRWNFKANMDKTISADNGQITLVLFLDF